MKYTVTLAGRTFEVDLSGTTARVDGEAVHAELHGVPGTPLRQLVTGDRSDVLAMTPGEERGTWSVVRAGETWSVEVVDERTRMLREMTGADQAVSGEQAIKAPMPGMVLRLEVEVGQRVEAGQGLLVLEAMKMENELKAHAAGVVRSIHVSEKQAVEKGTLLVEIAAE